MAIIINFEELRWYYNMCTKLYDVDLEIIVQQHCNNSLEKKFTWYILIKKISLQ